MGTYRLFIGADLPPHVKVELAAVQERLRQSNPPVKWVAPQAMHLTLRFLGETDVKLLPDLGAALGLTLDRHAATPLRLSGAGAFPNERRPSVVWVGVSGAVAALEQMQAGIEAAVVGIGFAPETRPFRAHLTLGRARTEASADQQERLGAAIRSLPPIAPADWIVNRIILFRSELSSAAPVYSEILEFRL